MEEKNSRARDLLDGIKKKGMKPWEFAIVALILALALSLFGCAYGASTCTESSAQLQLNLSADTAQGGIAAVQGADKYSSNDLVTMSSAFAEGMQKELSDAGVKAAVIYYAADAGVSPSYAAASLGQYSSNKYMRTAFNFRGHVLVSESTLSEFGFTLAEGRLPTAAEEVAVSLHAFETYKKTGYFNGTTDVAVNSAADLFNISVTYAEPYDDFGAATALKIVGIIDTHFEEEFFSTFENTESEIENAAYYQNAYAGDTLVSFHNTLFVAQSYVDSLAHESALGVTVQTKGERAALNAVLDACAKHEGEVGTADLIFESLARAQTNYILTNGSSRLDAVETFAWSLGGVLCVLAIAVAVLFLVKRSQDAGGVSYFECLAQTGFAALVAFVVSIGGTYGFCALANVYVDLHKIYSAQVYNVTGVQFAVLFAVGALVAGLAALVPWLLRRKEKVAVIE